MNKKVKGVLDVVENYLLLAPFGPLAPLGMKLIGGVGGNIDKKVTYSFVPDLCD